VVLECTLEGGEGEEKKTTMMVVSSFFLVPTAPWQRRSAPPATNEKKEERERNAFYTLPPPPYLASIHSHITPFSPQFSDWNSGAETMVILAGVHSLGLGRQTKPYFTA
jgi:hypothetical protein